MIGSPGAAPEALRTAPPPVSTAQPSRAATSGGTSAPTGTTERRSTTAWVANADAPRWCATGAPSRDSREPPPSSSPAAFEADAALTGEAPVRPAAGALAAARQEREHDPVADRDVADLVADALDDAGGLVAEQHRHRTEAGCRPRPTGPSGRSPPPRSARAARSGRDPRGRASPTVSGSESRYGSGRPISSSTAPVIRMRPPRRGHPMHPRASTSETLQHPGRRLSQASGGDLRLDPASVGDRDRRRPHHPSPCRPHRDRLARQPRDPRRRVLGHPHRSRRSRTSRSRAARSPSTRDLDRRARAASSRPPPAPTASSACSSAAQGRAHRAGLPA